MFKRKKKPATKFSGEIGAKEARHPIFTNYDQDRMNRFNSRVNEANAKIALLADHLGFVFMKHNRIGSNVLVDKKALKGQPFHNEPQIETEE